MSGVSIVILGKQNGVVSSDSGTFRIKVPAEKAFGLVFSFSGYHEEQKNFFISEHEQEQITVKLVRTGKTLQTVVIGDQKERTETGLVKINPKNATILPSATGGVEALIKILVGSNNELTSQYSVRGGNYDENLIYINDFEIFRPFLVSNAQQEGLSFINPELAKNISFYNGGFRPNTEIKSAVYLIFNIRIPRHSAARYISVCWNRDFTWKVLRRTKK
jgi:hypothetical protein